MTEKWWAGVINSTSPAFFENTMYNWGGNLIDFILPLHKFWYFPFSLTSDASLLFKFWVIDSVVIQNKCHQEMVRKQNVQNSWIHVVLQALIQHINGSKMINFNLNKMWIWYKKSNFKVTIILFCHHNNYSGYEHHFWFK